MFHQPGIRYLPKFLDPGSWVRCIDTDFQAPDWAHQLPEIGALYQISSSGFRPFFTVSEDSLCLTFHEIHNYGPNGENLGFDPSHFEPVKAAMPPHEPDMAHWEKRCQCVKELAEHPIHQRYQSHIHPELHQELVDLVRNKKWDKLKWRVAREGADVDACNEQGQSVLHSCLEEAMVEPVNLYAVNFTPLLLELGADPGLTDEHCCTSIFMVCLAHAESILHFLLDAGANPNEDLTLEYTQTVLETVIEDYEYSVFNWHYPDLPMKKDSENTDTWIDFLDRMAVKTGRIQPMCIKTLREFGAKTIDEIIEEKINAGRTHESV